MYVCMCAYFQANPKELHLNIVKHIMMYLTSTPLIGLWYPKETDCTLIQYPDFNFAGCKLDKKYHWNVSLAW